jgi:hypothetical protein
MNRFFVFAPALALFASLAPGAEEAILPRPGVFNNGHSRSPDACTENRA